MAKINMNEYEGGRVEVNKTEHATVIVRFPNISDEERERRRKIAEQSVIHLYKYCVDNGIPWRFKDEEGGKSENKVS